MELKLLLLGLFISSVSSSQAKVETETVEENDQDLRNEALYNDDAEDEGFLDDIDEDLDYFYTYEAIKNLQTMIPKLANGSDADVDMAEKFFLNFLTEDDYEEEEDYSYEYEDATDDLTGSEVIDLDYTELDDIDHDDFLYFDTLEDFVGQRSAGSAVSRDTVLMLILAAVVVVVLVFLLLLLFLRSRRHQSETSRGSPAEEEVTQAGSENLLKEIQIV